MKPEHTHVPVLPPSPHADSDCLGVASILSRVGDKWTVFVIMMLNDGPKRFNEIKRLIGGISQRMLTLTLRGARHYRTGSAAAGRPGRTR